MPSPKPKSHPCGNEQDFTAGGIHGLPSHQGSTGDPTMDERIHALVADWNCGAANPLIEEMIISALRIGRDNASVAELKLMNRSLKEMRTANNVFRPYQHVRKVTVFGSARTKPHKPAYKAAVAFGEKMRQHGYMTITGAGDGIMGAAQKGAGRDHSFGLNIRLPFEQDPNDTIEGDPKLIFFNYFFTRKLTFVKESHAVALFPGGYGTMDELFELVTLMQTGKASILPVVMVDAPGGSYWKTFLQFLREHLERLGMISEEDLYFFKVTDNVDEAVEEILQFYGAFHSYRFVRDRMVIRLNRALTDDSVTTLNRSFRDLLSEGEFTQSAALPEEKNETSILDLPRLSFVLHKRNYGRLRVLIDTINTLQTRP